MRGTEGCEPRSVPLDSVKRLRHYAETIFTGPAFHFFLPRPEPLRTDATTWSKSGGTFRCFSMNASRSVRKKCGPLDGGWLYGIAPKMWRRIQRGDRPPRYNPAPFSVKYRAKVICPSPPRKFRQPDTPGRARFYL